jgi:uncharacterized protein YegL
VKYLIALLISSTCWGGDNVVFLLDTSGSMERKMKGGVPRMRAAQDGIVAVLKQIPDGTNVGLLTFEGWAYEFGPLNRDAFQSAVYQTRPGGGTPLGEYLKIAADALLTQRAKNSLSNFKLIVVTDGEASDSQLLSRNLSDFVSRGIPMDSIGVDMPGTHALAKASARYMTASDPSSLTSALLTAAAETSTTGDVTADYDLIASLPENAAKAFITGVTSTYNHPIGTAPPTKPAVNEKGEVVQVPAPPPEESSAKGWVVAGIVLFVVVVAGMLTIFLKSSSY